MLRGRSDGPTSATRRASLSHRASASINLNRIAAKKHTLSSTNLVVLSSFERQCLAAEETAAAALAVVAGVDAEGMFGSNLRVLDPLTCTSKRSYPTFHVLDNVLTLDRCIPRNNELN